MYPSRTRVALSVLNRRRSRLYPRSNVEGPSFPARLSGEQVAQRCERSLQARKYCNRRSRELKRRLVLAWPGFDEEGGRDGAGVSGEDGDLDRVLGVVREVGCESGVEGGVLEG